jgi:heme A synthase
MPSPAFRKFAWGVLFYNVAVILWGALVRATSAGAGCGGHWPLCNGVALPELAAITTQIEFTHRMMSGLALAAVAGLYYWSRKFSSTVRRWAGWSLAFIILEALLGAGLVLFGFVAQDRSIGRVIYLALHLSNTLALLGALALTARYASAPEVRGPIPSKARWALVAVVIAAAAGAVTALGDTLFPAQSLAEGLRDDLASTANFLVRLRVIHPVLALLAAFVSSMLAWPAYRQKRRFAFAVLLAVVAAVLAGALNLVLRAPVWMQLVHLLIADLLWIALVLFANEMRGAEDVTQTTARENTLYAHE